MNIELSGKIEYQWGDPWETINLVQQDGYKINLVNRFVEIKNSFPDKKIQLSYYRAKNQCTKEQIKEGFIRKLMGFVDAEFKAEDYNYSEVTFGVDYETNLMVGGHDLFTELQDLQGQYIFMEIGLV